MATVTQSQNDNSTVNPGPGPGSSMDSMKAALGNNRIVNKATQFAKDRPWATATLAGVVGMALLNTLRGR